MASDGDSLESRLLAGMMRNGRGAAEVIGDIREEDFRSDPHRRIFRAMACLVERKAPVELASVGAELRRLGWVEDVGGYHKLAELFEAEPTGANLEYYARLVREAALLRRLGDAGRQVVCLAEEPGKQVEEALDEAERLVFAITEERLALLDDERHAGEVVGSVYDRIDQRATSGSHASGITTGLASLDVLTAGLQPSELTIVAARPSVGKTTVGMAMSLPAAMAGQGVLFISLEMPGEDLVERILCSLSGVNSQSVRRSTMTPVEASRYCQAGDRLRCANLHISDQPSQRVTRIAARARRRKAKGQLDLLVVDYLQLVEPDNRRDPRHEQVAQISRRLKLLARELKIPVVVLAQLNREADRRGSGGKPRLSDLRESGSIEQDADVVLLLHIPEEQRTRSLVDLEVHIAKNRNGPTGEVSLSCDRATGRISDPVSVTPFGG